MRCTSRRPRRDEKCGERSETLSSIDSRWARPAAASTFHKGGEASGAGLCCTVTAGPVESHARCNSPRRTRSRWAEGSVSSARAASRRARPWLRHQTAPGGTCRQSSAGGCTASQAAPSCIGIAPPAECGRGRKGRRVALARSLCHVATCRSAAGDSQERDAACQPPPPNGSWMLPAHGPASLIRSKRAQGCRRPLGRPRRARATRAERRGPAPAYRRRGAWRRRRRGAKRDPRCRRCRRVAPEGVPGPRAWHAQQHGGGAAQTVVCRLSPGGRAARSGAPLSVQARCAGAGPPGAWSAGSRALERMCQYMRKQRLDLPALGGCMLAHVPSFKRPCRCPSQQLRRRTIVPILYLCTRALEGWPPSCLPSLPFLASVCPFDFCPTGAPSLTARAAAKRYEPTPAELRPFLDRPPTTPPPRLRPRAHPGAVALCTIISCVRAPPLSPDARVPSRRLRGSSFSSPHRPAHHASALRGP